MVYYLAYSVSSQTNEQGTLANYQHHVIRNMTKYVYNNDKHEN